MYPSSGEFTVSMRHWYFSLCMGGCLVVWYIYFNFSTCFGQLCAHHQGNLLYLCDTGIFRSLWVAVWSFGIFISTSLHVSGSYVPTIKWNVLYLCDTGIFHSLWVAVWSANQPTRQPPIKSEKYQCRIDTVSSSGDGHMVARNM